ncbi:unnamed protein product [Durusdinium trenchii]|uniref:Apple domain-containing protein n=1 Tax=Durusdinium trenchii TaxID=1381693 RepID=A0ABP0HUL3_9DINO
MWPYGLLFLFTAASQVSSSPEACESQSATGSGLLQAKVLKKGLSNEDLLEEMKKLVTEVESKLEEDQPDESLVSVHDRLKKAVNASGDMAAHCTASKLRKFSPMPAAATQELTKQKDIELETNCDGIKLVEYLPQSTATSCCPSDNVLCAGCAKFESGSCVKCEGGFFKNPTDHICVACTDSMGWVTEEGLTCDALVGDGCNDRPVNGISSNPACCKCNGGTKAPTPFHYADKRFAIGDDINLHPIPRTAERYSVDSGCELGAHNLTINGTTGHISYFPKKEPPQKPFSLECEVTAHQNAGVSETVKVKITVDHWTYGTSVLILSPSESTFAPKTDQGTWSDFSMACAPEAPWLRLNHQTGQLTAGTSQGAVADADGISTQVYIGSSSTNEKCVPDPGHIHCDNTTQNRSDSYGDTFDVYHKGDKICARRLRTSGGWGLQLRLNCPRVEYGGGVTEVDEHLGLDGAICVANGWQFLQQGDAKMHEKRTNTFVVLRPRPWKALTYETTYAEVVAGEELPPIKLQVPAGYEEGTGGLRPSRFYVSCNVDVASYNGPTNPHYSYDSLMNVGLLGSHPLLEVDADGNILVAPAETLAKLFDDVGADALQRKSMHVGCGVWGTFPGTDISPLFTSLTLKIKDDMCWVSQRILGTVVLTKTSSTHQSCRNTCRMLKTCSHYTYHDAPHECRMYRVSTEGGDYVTVHAKVNDCTDLSTCIRLKHSKWAIQGDYCPVAYDITRGGPVYRKDSSIPEEVLYLSKVAAASTTTCGTSNWLVQAASKNDFIDDEMGYFELKGEEKLCLGAGLPSSHVIFGTDAQVSEGRWFSIYSSGSKWGDKHNDKVQFNAHVRAVGSFIIRRLCDLATIGHQAVLMKYGEEMGLEAERIPPILLNGLMEEETLVTFAIGSGGRQAPEVEDEEAELARKRRKDVNDVSGPGYHGPEVAPARAPVRPAPDGSPKRQEEPSQRCQRSPRERGPLVKEEERGRERRRREHRVREGDPPAPVRHERDQSCKKEEVLQRFEELDVSREDALVWVSGEDLTPSFYLFELPDCWPEYMTLGKPVMPHDVGLKGSSSLWVSLGLPVGWRSAGSFMQAALRELSLRAPSLGGHTG